MQTVFLRIYDLKEESLCQAFRTVTVETGNKNHCLTEARFTSLTQIGELARRLTSEEAYMAHMEICGMAVKMMSKIERNVDKFDSDSSDEDKTREILSCQFSVCSFFSVDTICKRKR